MDFRTIPDIIEYNAQTYPNEEAVIFEDKRATFGELKNRVSKRANVLLQAGVTPGDHVAILSINSMEFVETFLAVWSIGAVSIPVNWRLSAEELIYVVNHCQATFLIFQEQFTDTIEQITPSLTFVRKYLSFEPSSVPDVFDMSAALENASEEPMSVQVKSDDTLIILYTSGTTGRPKGVVASHLNYIKSCEAFREAIGSVLLERPKTLFSGPFFHAGGMLNMLLCFFFSSPQVIMKKFDADQFLSWIETEKVERIQGVASLYNMLLQSPNLKQFDLSSVRMVGSGAERMADETRNRFEEVFPGAKIFEGYGMTETCGFTTARAGEEMADKLTSVGKIIGEIELRILDRKGNDVESGHTGEILVRGPMIMKEYYNDPEKTAQAIQNGWLFTGDIGMLDEDGYLYVMERKNDMIKTGGENVYPKEVENVLYQHPKIVEAAVFGLPDKIWGQKICAAVVLEKDSQSTKEELIDFCKERLASFKKPKEVFFLDTLTRTFSGKIKRSELRKQFSI